MENSVREAKERVVFSEDGAKLAVCGLDGEVKVWSSATGTLTTRFTPEGARGVAIAAATWSRCLHKRKSGKKIALAVGSKVVVWNETKGQQECVLSAVHTGLVNGTAWGPANTHLYSGSEDKHVVVWDTGTWECTHKWQADRNGIKCICCHNNRDLVVTAARSIKLWCSNSYSLLKRFTGHATSVSSLLFIGDNLLLSSATDDRILNLWNMEAKGSGAIASFACEEEVASCYVTVSKDTVYAVALAQEGVVHIFKYPLTNQIAAPISAHSMLQFTSPSTQSDTPSPLPVLSACLTPDGITVAHTSTIKPRIETVRWSECKRGTVCLVRERVAGLLLNGLGDRRGNQSPPQSVTVLGPGHMATYNGHCKDMPTNQIATEAPLSSRLQTAEAAQASSGERKSRVATADSLSRLLAQAVQSGDKTLLEEPLKVRKEVIIRQTIRRLPVGLVVPLLKQLIHLLETSPGRGLELSLWVRHVLTQHSSYLMTQPQLVSTLSSFYQVLEARSSVYNKLCRIHGKLDLMNIHESDEASGSSSVPAEALMSVTIGDEVISSSSESESDQSDGELSEDDKSDSETEVAMDTAEHVPQQLT